MRKATKLLITKSLAIKTFRGILGCDLFETDT